jgi:hypothetical protein
MENDDEAVSVALTQAGPVSQLGMDQPAPAAGSGGQLEIFRPKRGSVGLFSAYHVIVDGGDVGEVKRGQSQVVPVAPGRHEVHLEIGWCRSPSIAVEVVLGETVKLVCWPKFQFWQAKRGLNTPDDWIVLERAADVDG